MSNESVAISRDGRFLTFKRVEVETLDPKTKRGTGDFVCYDIQIEVQNGDFPRSAYQMNIKEIRALAAQVFGRSLSPAKSEFTYVRQTDKSQHRNTETEECEAVTGKRQKGRIQAIYRNLFENNGAQGDVLSRIPVSKEAPISPARPKPKPVPSTPPKSGAPTSPTASDAAISSTAAPASDLPVTRPLAAGGSEEQVLPNAAPAREELAPASLPAEKSGAAPRTESAAPKTKARFDFKPYMQASDTFVAFDLAFKNFRDESTDFSNTFPECSRDDLEVYAEDRKESRTPKKPELKNIYNAFVTLLNEPESTDLDAKLLRELLERLNAIAYHRRKKSIDSSNAKTEDAVRKACAGLAVKFVPVDVDSTDLVDYLVNTSLPSF